MLDDVFAELDAKRRAQLVDFTADAEQLLITAAVAEDTAAVMSGAGLLLMTLSVTYLVPVIQASVSSRPSPGRMEWGWLAKPVRWRAAKRKSPDRSPVNTRPVRLAPWAAGARPTSTTRASGSPKPGTGRPQYSSSRNAARFSVATCSRHATSRGQARHCATCSPSRSRAPAGSVRESPAA